MRIISGKFRGRKLVDSKNLKSLRPTTDMAREALFNILVSSKKLREIFKAQDVNILDICCGSGAVAFEALSRFAKTATLIDSNRAHLEVAKKNAEILGVASQAKILQLDAKKLPLNKEFFDLVFIDPPYEEDYFTIIQNLVEKAWIQKKSLVVIEHDKTSDLENIAQFLEEVDSRNYGKTSFSFLQLRN